MKYLPILCFKCRRPIGSAKYHLEVNAENGLVYFYHNLSDHDCWEQVCEEVDAEFWFLLMRVKRSHV